jgi:hypothetical protein
MIDHAPGRGANRFKSGAYTLVFEYFESVCNKAIGALDAFLKWILIVADTVCHHKKHAAEFG